MINYIPELSCSQIHFPVTNEEFVAFFQQFGELVDCLVMFDRDTRRSRGFGFVTYVDPEVSARLLSTGNDGDDNIGRLYMGEKLVEIKAAQPKPSDGSRRVRAFKASPEGHPSGNSTGQTSISEPSATAVYMPDGSPAAAYYPSYDGSGSYMPGIYGSVPPEGFVPQPNYYQSPPAFFPMGPAVIPMAGMEGVSHPMMPPPYMQYGHHMASPDYGSVGGTPPVYVPATAAHHSVDSSATGSHPYYYVPVVPMVQSKTAQNVVNVVPQPDQSVVSVVPQPVQNVVNVVPQQVQGVVSVVPQPAQSVVSVVPHSVPSTATDIQGKKV